MLALIGLCILAAVAALAAEGDLRPARLSEHRTPYHDPAVYRAARLHGEITGKPRAVFRESLGSSQGGGSLRVADLNGDGVAEVLHLDSGAVRAYDLDGRLLWDAGMLGVDEVVSIANLNDSDDGSREIVLGRRAPTDARLVILSGATGEVLWRKQFPAVWFFGGFAAGQFDLPQADWSGKDRRPTQILAFYSGGPIGNRSYAECFNFLYGVEHPTFWIKQLHEGSVAGQVNWLMRDYDGDGAVEVVACQQYSVIALDVRSGDDKFRATWRTGTGRNYGRCYLSDLDGDGRLDFTIYATATDQHVTAVRNLGRTGEVLYRELLGFVWAEGGDEVQLIAPPQPPLDFDGDGRQELLFSVRNYKGDHQTHLLVVGPDPANGGVKLDLVKDCTVAGVADVDGDGLPEALIHEGGALVAYRLLPREPGAGIEIEPQEVWQAPGLSALIRKTGPEFSHLKGGEAEVWALDLGRTPRPLFMRTPDGLALMSTLDGRLTELWRAAGVEPLDGWSGLPWQADMDGDGAPECLMRVGDTVEAWRWTWHDGPPPTLTPERVWPAAGVTVPASAVLQDVNADGVQELVTTNGGAFTVTTLAGQELHAATLPSAWAPAIVGLEAVEGAPTRRLVVRGVDGETHQLVPADGRFSLQPAQAVNPGPTAVRDAFACVACDLDGDAADEYVYVDATRRRLAAVREDGAELWAVALANDCYRLLAGRFLGRPGHDVAVTYNAAEGRAGWLVCYNGQTGEEAWAIDRVRFGVNPEDWRGLLGWPIVWDLTGDGADDIAIQCNDYYAPIRGRDGTLLATPRSWGTCWGGGIHLVDVDGDDVPEVLHADPIGATAVVVARLDGTPLWVRNLTLEALGGWVVPADTAGDGKRALGCVLHDGTLQCWDGLTGQTRWTVPLDGPARPATVLAADLDGDGCEEFLLLSGGGLLCCIKEVDGRGEVIWTLRDPAGWAAVQVLDCDGDGLLELVVTALDGTLSVLR